MKIKIVRLILAALFLTFLLSAACSGNSDSRADSERSAQNEESSTKAASKLPRMLDLGSVDCIPCKKMAPILDSLKIVYQGKAEIEFIDIRKNMAAAREHGVTMIPTQIFFDVEGKEVSRHIGFFPADSIAARLSAIGAML